MVTISAEPDDIRSIGHARIVIDGLAAPPADPGFRIIREGYPTPNLGRRGWQVAEERLQPVATLREGGRVVLVVGPAVTIHLLVEPYQFALPAAGVEGALFWPEIDVYDGELPEPPEPEPPAPASPPPSPPPATSPAPVVDTPPPVAPVAEASAPPGAKAPGGSRVPLILAGVIVALLAGGAAAWWALGPDRRSPPTPPSPAPAATTPPAPAATAPPPAAVAPAPVWPAGTDALSLADVVARAPDPAGIHAVALRRQQEGKYDDALVLFEEAAARSYGPSLTALARMWDPNGFVANRPLRNPDARTAADYYLRAVRAGDASADAPRAALRTWLEQQRAAGNANADSYLREYWP